MAPQYGNIARQQKDGTQSSSPGDNLYPRLRAAFPAAGYHVRFEQKIDTISRSALLVVAGYILCLATNHVHQLWMDHGQLAVVQTQVVPALKAKAGCEKWRASVATGVAHQAIKGANSDYEPIPDAKDIPADNCLPAPSH